MKNYTTFKGPYVLIEDSKNKFQPIYKEYTRGVPSLSLDSPVLCCPFSTARRTTRPKKKCPIKAGYCEICYVKYENYSEHVNCKEHREYAEDDYNYRMIDVFIKDMLEHDLYGGHNVLHSPCEKLEAEFSSNKQIFYNNDSGPDSLIRLSIGSAGNVDNVVDFDIILNKIDKKFPQGK